MKLNYIDIDETPVSVTFVADEIRIINSFFKETKDQISNFNRNFAMEQIAETFEEINKKLEEHNDARL
jgi:hypothetical protein